MSLDARMNGLLVEKWWVLPLLRLLTTPKWSETLLHWMCWFFVTIPTKVWHASRAGRITTLYLSMTMVAQVKAYPVEGGLEKAKDPLFGLAMGEASQISTDLFRSADRIYQSFSILGGWSQNLKKEFHENACSTMAYKNYLRMRDWNLVWIKERFLQIWFSDAAWIKVLLNLEWMRGKTYMTKYFIKLKLSNFTWDFS